MLTQKMENFVNNLFQGMTQREAWIQAGYSSKYAMKIIDENACRMANTNKIKTRLEELRQAAKSALVLTAIERKEILSEIGRARLTDYVACGPDRDLVSVGPESPNTAAFQEITSRTEFDDDGAGVAVVTKLKLHNPISAIDLLNKMDHIYDDKTPTGTTIVNSFTFVLPNGEKVSPKQLKEVDDDNHD